MKLPYIHIAFFALLLVFSLSANLAADTVSWPVSVAVPESGIDGALYGRPVSVAVPELGIDGALYGRPVSVAFPDEIRSGSYIGQPVALKVEGANTIDPDIVGLWHMDGDWLDSSGFLNDGIPYNGPAFSSDHMVGTKSGSLDGTDDSIQITDSPTLHSDRALSVLGWFYVREFDKTLQSIFWKGNPYSTTEGEKREFALWIKDDGLLHFNSAPADIVGIGHLTCNCSFFVVLTNIHQYR